MKTHYNFRPQIIVRFFCVIALIVVTQSIFAWDYLIVYRNNGEKPLMLYSLDIDSLVCSKIGTDSILYTDWQVQEIWTPDTTYRIPLACIDSISIKTVDTVSAAINVVETSIHISKIFVQAETIKELASHLDEIQNMEKVEMAWLIGTTLFVKVKDWGTISFSYPIPYQPSNDEDEYDEEKGESTRRVNNNSWNVLSASNTHFPLDYIKICIVNQCHYDLNRQYEYNKAKQMSNTFAALGFSNQKYIYGRYFGVDFLNKDIYDYDLILMATHGEYDGQRHWIYTGREYFVSQDFKKIDKWTDDINQWDDLLRNLIDIELERRNSPNCVSCGFIKEKRKNYRDEIEDVLVCYAKISETGFSKIRKRFSEDCTTIFFNVACQSMQDNHSFPISLIRKGLGYYLGYTHSNNIGWRACEEFTKLLLNGYDVGRAEELMSIDNKEQLIDELDSYGNVYLANSRLEKESNPNLPNTHLCIVKPVTLDTALPFNGILYGKIRQLNPSKTDFIYGFCISKDEEMKSAEILSGIRFNQCQYNPSSHILSFDVKLEDFDNYKNGKYYYCAYIYDGKNYCFGDVKSFEIVGRLQLCPDNNHPHLVDLGLPSGTKWACCNIGANTPSEKGKLYAWGETEEKSDYNFSTYEHRYDGYYDDNEIWHDAEYIDIGKDISGSRYDCASYEWGAPWRMPTENDCRELLMECKWTQGVELNGMHGRLFMAPNYETIFLPDVSYWTSTVNTNNKGFAYYFNINNTGTWYREFGCYVRPVSK